MAARKPAREKATTEAGTRVVLNIRESRATLARLDAWMRRLNHGNFGPQWTRSRIIHVLLTRALDERAERGEP